MPNSPYTGLNPFSIKDAPFFFGRDHEQFIDPGGNNRYAQRRALTLDLLQREAQPE